MVTTARQSNMAKKKSATPASSKKGGKSPEGMEEVYKREPGLKTTLEQIEKQFGEGSIMPLGGEALLKISGVTTGSLSLDMALGGVGVPRGRIIEIFGIDRHARAARFLEDLEQTAKRGGLIDRLDIGARNHQVLDTDLAEPEDVVQHGAFVGRERLVQFTAGLQRVVEVLADGFAVGGRKHGPQQTLPKPHSRALVLLDDQISPAHRHGKITGGFFGR